MVSRLSCNAEYGATPIGVSLFRACYLYLVAMLIAVEIFDATSNIRYDKLGMLIGAIGLRTLMYEVHSHVVGTLYEAMVTRNVSQFVTYSSINVVVDLISAVVEASTVFAQNNLGTTWHAQLTEYASKRLFKGNSFYKLRNLDKRIGDPDQRLTVEMQDATNEFATIWGP